MRAVACGGVNPRRPRRARADAQRASAPGAGCHDCAARGTVVPVGHSRAGGESTTVRRAEQSWHAKCHDCAAWGTVVSGEGRRVPRLCRLGHSRVLRGTRCPATDAVSGDGRTTVRRAEQSWHAKCHDCAAWGTVVSGEGRGVRRQTQCPATEARLFAEPNSRGTPPGLPRRRLGAGGRRGCHGRSARRSPVPASGRASNSRTGHRAKRPMTRGTRSASVHGLPTRATGCGCGPTTSATGRTATASTSGRRSPTAAHARRRAPRDHQPHPTAGARELTGMRLRPRGRRGTSQEKRPAAADAQACRRSSAPSMEHLRARRYMPLPA